MADDRDALNELRKVSCIEAAHSIKNFLYLPNRIAADNVVLYLRSLDITADEPLKSFDSWLVRVQTVIVPTVARIVELRSLFERAAHEYGGEYDGWEAEVTT